jgi:hypothetical protein
MPIPRHSTVLAHVQLPATASLNGIIELRVHGVGGTPPDALLGDLAPEQVAGDQVAGFYRSGDHHASPPDRAEQIDVDRHVEAYSWGGLTSRSRTRVLWLALLPFMLGNLSGWMCSDATKRSPWRFPLHRLASGLAGLALTVNAMLVAAFISANVLAYQAGRGVLAGNQWWLAPLRWHLIAGHPARQVLLGVAVPELLLLALLILAWRSWRYEAIRPPVHAPAHERPPKRTAAALAKGLADDEFWDGAASVRLASWLHLAVATAFLALFLSVTVHALPGARPASQLWWAALILGGVTVAAAVVYVLLDAVDLLPEALRDAAGYLVIPAVAALIAAGVFAWWQPGRPALAAQLPGLATVLTWTTLALAVCIGFVLLSTLVGAFPLVRETLPGGPLVTLMVAFGVLNTILLAAGIWIAHLAGPVSTNAAAVVKAATTKHPKLYLPYLITTAAPLVALAAGAAVLVFGLIIAACWWRTRSIPETELEDYRADAQTMVNGLPDDDLRVWYRSGVPPFLLVGDSGQQVKDPGWRKKAARGELEGGLSHRASWLLWGIVVFQVAMAISVWRFQPHPPVFISNAGIALAGLALPALMGFLLAAWNDPARRRRICVLWDVGTFWPRSYHPFSPPCYAERAVPDLQRRMWWLHDNGGRVVLVAHSQGAVLATAALVQAGCRPGGDRPVLITFGCPVRKLYQWGFPAYLTQKLIDSLAAQNPENLATWKNINYPTDPIGGPVGVDAVDETMCDPKNCYYVYGQNPPAPTGHSGYWSDPRVWALVDQAAVLAGDGSTDGSGYGGELAECGRQSAEVGPVDGDQVRGLGGVGGAAVETDPGVTAVEVQGGDHVGEPRALAEPPADLRRGHPGQAGHGTADHRAGP